MIAAAPLHAKLVDTLLGAATKPVWFRPSSFPPLRAPAREGASRTTCQADTKVLA